jgi:hypothetical protein
VRIFSGWIIAAVIHHEMVRMRVFGISHGIYRAILGRLCFTGLKSPNQWRTQEFFFSIGGGSTNSVEDRGQRERGSGGGSPLVRGSTQFANE